MIELIAFLASGGLFYWGGQGFLLARRVLMPYLLMIVCLLATRDLWCLTMMSAYGVETIGYGPSSPFYHCFGNGWGRGAWGLLVAIALSLALFLTGHLVWYWFVAYLLAGFTLENAFKNLPVWIGDPIIGLGFGSIVLIIR